MPCADGMAQHCGATPRGSAPYPVYLCYRTCGKKAMEPSGASGKKSGYCCSLVESRRVNGVPISGSNFAVLEWRNSVDKNAIIWHNNFVKNICNFFVAFYVQYVDL
jgi:hypothetical protein